MAGVDALRLYGSARPRLCAAPGGGGSGLRVWIMGAGYGGGTASTALAMEVQGCGLVMNLVAASPPPGRPCGEQPRRRQAGTTLAMQGRRRELRRR